MKNLIHYLSQAPAQKAGELFFLAALGLLFGSAVLAFFAEFKRDSGARENFSYLSARIAFANLFWIIFTFLLGGGAIFLPRLQVLKSSFPLQAVAVGAGVSLLFYIFYLVSARFLRIRFLHALLALPVATGALFAAAGWYLPSTLNQWLETAGRLTTAQEISAWWLQHTEVAAYVLLKLTGIAFAALLFLLANAKDKENRRKQPRDYYFKAAAFAEKWLLLVIFLAFLPLAWLYYATTLAAGRPLLAKPDIYWLFGILIPLLLGWLLLAKITFDGLVNRRATLIVTVFFVLALLAFQAGPLGSHPASLLRFSSIPAPSRPVSSPAPALKTSSGTPAEPALAAGRPATADNRNSNEFATP